jgi:hypothetical protein
MILKSTTARDENLDMSDLSNLLGAVYGNTDPDGPPVRQEASASERMEAASWGQHVVAFETQAPSVNDNDIASALSAALMDSAPVSAPAPVFDAPAPVVSLIETPAPAPAPQPAMAAPVSMAAPAPSTWSNAATVMAPPVAAVAPPRLWIFGDDDIFPGGKSKSGSKKGRR